jgi:hypothetical protein
LFIVTGHSHLNRTIVAEMLSWDPLSKACFVMASASSLTPRPSLSFSKTNSTDSWCDQFSQMPSHPNRRKQSLFLSNHQLREEKVSTLG